MGQYLVGPDLKKESTTAALPSALSTSQEGFESDLAKRLLFKSPTNGNVYFYSGDPNAYTGTGALSGVNGQNNALDSLASAQTLNNQFQNQTFLVSGLTQGSLNLYMGYSSGNGSGVENIGIGQGALGELTTGSENTAIGSIKCMNMTTTGSWNVALGLGALSANTVGSYSVAIGANAIGGGTAAAFGQNVAIGFQAMQTASGDYNVAVGYNAGNNNNAGVGNVMIGWSAACNSAVNHSIVLGYGATSTYDNCINIGYNPSSNTNNFAGSTIIGGVYTTDTLLVGNVQTAQIGSSVYSLGVASGGLSSDTSGNLVINGDTLKFANKRTVAGQYSGGYAGEICYDDSYVYVCIGTGNHWCRVPLTW